MATTTPIVPQSSSSNDKRSWKLLIDPQLKKGLQKLYRFDGVCPSAHGHRVRFSPLILSN
jgi:hypothetical protein